MLLFNTGSSNLIEYLSSNDVQKFDWGDVIWVHEPSTLLHNRASVSIIRFFPNKTQERHFHMSEEQILYVIKGEGVHIIDDQSSAISKSMFIYCPPYTDHKVINTGDSDLILVVIYIPTKLRTLENKNTEISNINLREFLSLELLTQIEIELSKVLKLTVSFLDIHNNEIIGKNTSDDVCILCSEIDMCTKKKYYSDNTANIFDKVYKCKYGLGVIEIPINIHGEIVGYIECKDFIIGDLKEIEENLLDLSFKLDIDLEEVKKNFYNKQVLLKSRMYAIEETIDEVTRFIKEIIDRKYFEKELVQKDWEILEYIKEKLQLKDKLMEANTKLSYENVLTNIDNSSNRQRVYPYMLEKEIGDAITTINSIKLNKIISSAKNKYSNPKGIVEEMVVSLIRTTLLNYLNFDESIKLREKYISKLKQNEINREVWNILTEFSMECITIIGSEVDESNELIYKINNFINLNFDKDINLNLISDTFYLSPNYVSTLFNEKNGVSISDYINKLRINEAKKLLSNSNIKIKQIAKKVGYTNDSYFINVFRKLVNMTPGEYRKKY